MTGSGMRPLDGPCGEQGKRPTAKAFKLAERDINMSEQKQSSFMEELDRWTESTIIGPLFASETDGEDWEPAIERVKKAIRTKVLESYRNGQVAGPRQPRQPAVEQRRAFQR
jgi:hypothetical protein